MSTLSQGSNVVSSSSSSQPNQKYQWNQSRLPKGKYDAVIEKATSEYREAEGYYKVRLDLEIQSDGRCGQPEHKEYHLKSKKALDFMRGEFEKLGVGVADPDQLEDACKAVEGKPVRITVDYLANGNRAIYIGAMQSKDQSKQSNYAHIWG